MEMNEIVVYFWPPLRHPDNGIYVFSSYCQNQFPRFLNNSTIAT